MTPWEIFDTLSPHARVATAVAPFVAAMALRVVLGQNRWTGLLISISTTWVAVNVLLAPYSAGMRDDILRLGDWFR
jgi:hypothetical protein